MGSHVNRSWLLGIAVVVGSALTSPPGARAGTIVDLGAAGCAGLVVCAPLIYPDGVLTLTADGGTFTTKTRNGATGLGISGSTRGEIDVLEYVRGGFSTAVSLDAFTVLFLYNGGEFNDPSEIAQVSINGGSIVATLVANAENNAVWSLGGATVSSCGDTNVTGTGCFRVANPFGGNLISDIVFTAATAGPGLPNDSDFSLGTIELAAVPSAPEPGLLMLLATASLALAARHRRAAH